MSISKWIEENLDKYDTREEFMQAGSKELKCRHDSLCKAIKRNKVAYAKFPPVFHSKKKKITQSIRQRGASSLDTFRNKFDKSIIIPKKIEEGIEKYLRLADGRPGYMSDHEFRERLGVSNNIWRRFANEYDHLQVKVDGTIYWGHPDIADKMKEITLR